MGPEPCGSAEPSASGTWRAGDRMSKSSEGERGGAASFVVVEAGSHLCSRCGAVVPPAVLGPDGRGEGACPDCGLGFSSVGNSAFTRSEQGPVAQWLAGRRSARQLRNRRAERHQVIRRRSFPVHGLDGRWTGSRWIGGWGGPNRDVDHIDLAHGNPHDHSAPLVRITTWRLSPRSAELTVAHAAQNLAEHLWRDAGAPHDLVRSTFTSDDPTIAWSERELSIDQRATAFRSLAQPPHWVALARIESSLITIEARRIEPDKVALVTVENIEPYLEDPPSPPNV